MPDKINHATATYDVVAACGGFGSLCGALSYLLSVEEGKPFRWSEFALHTVISGVFGWIAYVVLAYEGAPHELAGALCGVAGWGGTRLIRLLQIFCRKRLGVTKEDLHNDCERN